MTERRKQSFRDLKVWQRGCDLSVATYRLTEGYPKAEVFGLTSQMNRCAASVPANIAEGRARGTDPEFRRFLRIAAGSLAELETFLEISSRLGYATPEVLRDVAQTADEVGKMLYGLMARLQPARKRR